MSDRHGEAATAVQREALLNALGEQKDQIRVSCETLEGMVRELQVRWGVNFFETSKSLVDYVDEVAAADLSMRYRAAHEQAASQVSRGGVESAVYEAMCNPELLGIVTSARWGIFVDSIAATSALIRELHITGPILDVGCHAGIACDILGSFVKNDITGIDPLKSAIDVARLRIGSRVSFDIAAMPWLTDKRFDLVLAIDSMPVNISDRARFLQGISDVMNPGGVAYIVSPHFVNTNIETLRRQLKNSALGFGFADVVGGFSGAPTQFSIEGSVALIKGGKQQVPRRLGAIMESEWESFRSYANLSSTDRSKKTQAFKRARVVE